MSLPCDPPLLCRTYFCIGRRQALSLELEAHEADECAYNFRAEMLALNPLPTDLRFLHSCARNHAADWVRARNRHAPRAALSLDDQNPVPAACVLPDATRTVLGRIAFWQEMEPFLQRLKPQCRAMLLDQIKHSLSIAQIAAKYNRTPHAVEEALRRSRKNLLEWIQKENVTASELYSLLQASDEGGGG